MKRFIIGGTGRSGTKWCATVLRNAGIYCGHEMVFTTAMLPNMEIPRWDEFEGDSSLAAVPYFDDYPDITKILVVRNPYEFVSSMLKAGPLIAGSQPAGLNEYLDEHYPWIRDADTEVEAALLYWKAWNQLGALSADIVLRIEDLEPRDLYEAVGIRPRWHPYPVGIVNSSPNYTQGIYDLDDVDPGVLEMVNELAASFGYDVEDQ